MKYRVGSTDHHIPKFILVSLLIFSIQCAHNEGEDLNPDDLMGTWRVLSTGVTLVFESGNEGQVYSMRDPQGYYGYPGDDLLVQGYWYVSGSSLYLEDEVGPLSCPPNDDRFVVLMDDNKSNMWLTHLGGDECADRTRALEDHTWQRVNEG
ncbi:hypothetical protein ACFL5M_03005 [Candidatus Neomarinimicrobiota bacterium]